MITGNEPVNPNKEYGNIGTDGLTIRQYYAGMAMQAYASKNGWGVDDIVKYSLLTTDALINALNEKE